MRDLVLAGQFREDEILFACRNLEGHIMDKIPYPIMILSSMAVEELIMIVKQAQIDMLVIDHYGICYEDEKRIKEATGVKIFSFDGSYKKHHCDYLLNQNIYADAKKYQELVPSFCKVFCGLEYALIRDEFKNEKKLQKKTNSEDIKVLVTLGGADPHNMTLETLKTLEKVTDRRFEIVVVLGGANPHKKEIEAFIQMAKHRYIMIVDTDSMASLMRGIDFAVSSAGTTSIELLYMQIPFFALSIVKNQDLIFQYLIENDLAYDFGTFQDEILKLVESGFKINNPVEIGTKVLAKEIA